MLHMLVAVQRFDTALSGYVDWREVACALLAAARPAIHTATTAVVAQAAQALAAADGDSDGWLTAEEWEGAHIWFTEPTPAELEAAAAANEVEAGGQTQPRQQVADDDRKGEAQQAAASALKRLLWTIFASPLPPAVRAETTPAADSADGAASSGLPANGPSGSASPEKQQQQPRQQQLSQHKGQPPTPTAQTHAAPSQPQTVAPQEQTAAAPMVPPAQLLLPWQALLLYLCIDRDLSRGIQKAVAAVTKDGASAARAAAGDVVKICWPLLGPEVAAPLQGLPLTAAQVVALVQGVLAPERAGAGGPAASGARRSSGGGGVEGMHSGSGGGAASGGATGGAMRKSSAGGGGEVQQADGAAGMSAGAAAGATVVQQHEGMRAQQLLTNPAFEKVVKLLLHRYRFVDMYVSCRL